jgi:SAM-dependent methyltransferase
MEEQFNIASKHYDEVFTNSLIGKVQRKRVYYWLDKVNMFQEKKNWLEINCGTGHDANIIALKGNNVICTDASSRMLEVASKKFPHIQFQQSRFDELRAKFKTSQTDVIFSNFGGLNCIDTSGMNDFIEDVSILQSTGQKIALVIMPRFCLMEMYFFGLRFQFKKAFQRSKEFAIVDVDGVQVKTFYHSPKSMRELLLLNNYKVVLTKPVALFIPPSYLEKWMVKFPFLLKFLSFHERLFGQFNLGAGLADHYIIIAEKK